MWVPMKVEKQERPNWANLDGFDWALKNISLPSIANGPLRVWARSKTLEHGTPSPAGQVIRILPHVVQRRRRGDHHRGGAGLVLSPPLTVLVLFGQLLQLLFCLRTPQKTTRRPVITFPRLPQKQTSLSTTMGTQNWLKEH